MWRAGHTTEETCKRFRDWLLAEVAGNLWLIKQRNKAKKARTCRTGLPICPLPPEPHWGVARPEGLHPNGQTHLQECSCRLEEGKRATSKKAKCVSCFAYSLWFSCVAKSERSWIAFALWVLPFHSYLSQPVLASSNHLCPVPSQEWPKRHEFS